MGRGPQLGTALPPGQVAEGVRNPRAGLPSPVSQVSRACCSPGASSLEHRAPGRTPGEEKEQAGPSGAPSPLTHEPCPQPGPGRQVSNHQLIGKLPLISWREFSSADALSPGNLHFTKRHNYAWGLATASNSLRCDDLVPSQEESAPRAFSPVSWGELSIPTLHAADRGRHGPHTRTWEKGPVPRAWRHRPK